MAGKIITSANNKFRCPVLNTLKATRKGITPLKIVPKGICRSKLTVKPDETDRVVEFNKIVVQNDKKPDMVNAGLFFNPILSEKVNCGQIGRSKTLPLATLSVWRLKATNQQRPRPTLAI